MCEKKQFQSEKQAKTAIRTIKKNSKRSHIPTRAYFCKDCKTWHLTSLTKNTFDL